MSSIRAPNLVAAWTQVLDSNATLAQWRELVAGVLPATSPAPAIIWFPGTVVLTGDNVRVLHAEDFRARLVKYGATNLEPLDAAIALCVLRRG